MTPFTPPTQDQLLAIRVNAGIDELAQAEKFAHAESDLVEAIVEGVGQFAAGEFAPLNRIGDLEGAKLENGVVRLPDGFKEAYQGYVEQGWNSIGSSADFGGQGLPFTLSCNVLENLGSANMAFCLLPMLSVGAIEALEHHGSDAQKSLYLPDLISGKWSGTMNLTEPAAGSDVGALRSTAEPITDGEHAGKYKIKGQKIYITWGDHTLADNIIHLVLARIEGAEPGTKGLSLFIVPRVRINEDGSLGEENDVTVPSIEHKMGINGSATCVMNFGDEGKCLGEVVGGVEHQGIRQMFHMMNAARMGVGIQGIAIGDVAYQNGAIYANERLAGRALSGAKNPDASADPIIVHPDVRRMLLTMRANILAGRALSMYAALQLDVSRFHPDADVRAKADKLVALLIPVQKAYCSDRGFDVCVLGQQVLGGHGYVAEWGLEQNVRDARIAQIYEGANGVQALDLVGRKMLRDGGKVAMSLMADMRASEAPADLKAGLDAAIGSLESATQSVLRRSAEDPALAGAVSADYLELFGLTLYAWFWARMAQAAPADEYGDNKRHTARYFYARILPKHLSLVASIDADADAVMALPAEAF